MTGKITLLFTQSHPWSSAKPVANEAATNPGFPAIGTATSPTQSDTDSTSAVTPMVGVSVGIGGVGWFEFPGQYPYS